MASLATIPASQPQATTEDLVWGVDVAALLVNPQTVTLAAAALFDQTTQLTVVLSDSASLAGTIISQRVRAGVLTANHQYRLTVSFTPSGTTNIVNADLGLVCPR